ncbi:type I methionyl aminopeptidase [soil metagenome]
MAMKTVLRSNDPCWCGSGRKYKRCHKLSDEPVRPGKVSPRRTVPASVPHPDYAEGGVPGSGSTAAIQKPDVIERMRRAGQIAAEVLAVAAAEVRPGVTTEHIDEVVHQACIERGVYPSTLGYKGYPKSCCTSVNEVICHGIPDDRALLDGDIINIDVTVFVDGVHGDTSATYPVGEIAPESQELIDVTREAMELGIRAVHPDRPISDIGKAISGFVEPKGYGVVRVFGGHGIGERFHTSLHIPHYYEPRADTLMKPNMVFTIEPMITMGSYHHRVWPDTWTAVTTDLKRTAQFEHTVVVTKTGAEVLTPSPTSTQLG